MSDTRKPFVAGSFLGAEPREIHGIWYVHGGPVDAISRVYIQGYELAGAARDYPTIDDLQKASVPAGGFATCLAEGAFRASVGKDERVSADVVNTMAGVHYPPAADRGSVRTRSVTDITPTETVPRK